MSYANGNNNPVHQQTKLNSLRKISFSFLNMNQNIYAMAIPTQFMKNKFRTHSIHNFFHLLLLSFQPENCLSSYNPHGYCVIYSSADRGSFVVAERIIQALWTSENIAQRAVILVGNKADLARSRTITSEGKFNAML